MSFFGQYPYHTQPRRSHPVHPHPYTQSHPHPFAGNHLNLFGGDYPQEIPSALYHPQTQFQGPATLTPNSNSIDDEERAAIAHLRSIQRRKEVERIIREEAERERAIAELQAHREREREREAAIIARVKHERELAAARAKAEKEREYAQLLAQIQRQDRQREMALAAEQKRQALARQLEQHRQQQVQQQQQRNALLSAAAHAQQQEHEERRRQCARQCGARRSVPATPTPATKDQEQSTAESVDEGLENLNRLIGSLFGIQFEPESKSKEVKKPEVPSPVPQAEKKESTPAPAPAPASKEQSTSESVDDGRESLNRLIGSLFGIQFDPECKSKEEKKSEVPVPVPAAPVAAQATANATTAEPSIKTPAPAAEEKKAEFPDAINHLLSNYLGLRVEPESKLGQAVSNQASKVPEGLNELLGQFGLEFVPDVAKNEPGPSTATTNEASSTTKVPDEKKTEQPKPTAAASSSSSSTAPAEQPGSRPPFDLSEFLSGQNGLPPFIRDILGNVELAFKEQQEGKQEQQQKDKGKGVAEGEKKTKVESAPAPAPAPAPAQTAATVDPAAAPTPTPVSVPEPTSAPAPEEVDPKKVSSESISKLESIQSEIQLARDSFTFPSTLSFASTSNVDAAPSLLFNKQNKPYHAQNNKLLQLLLQADGIASNGDREVRRKRKEVVKLVESELEGLERKRDELWTEVKERRERSGESSDDESAGSWTTGSVVDPEEQPVHVEDVNATVESTTEQSPETTETTEHEIPTSFADAVKSTTSTEVSESTETVEADETNNETQSAPEPSTEPSDKVESEEKVEKVEQKKEKEEGYELV